MKNFLFYDLEIIKAIPDKFAPKPGIEYCKGWRDFANMGISCVGWHFNSMYCVDWRDNSGFLDDIGKCDGVIGFNSLAFDDNLMAANGFAIFSDYDMLIETRIAAGFGADYKSVPSGYSYSLAKLAEANGMKKTGDGANAAILWQQGKQQEVLDYCANDVNLTVKLFKLGQEGKLIDPNTGNKLQLRKI